MSAKPASVRLYGLVPMTRRRYVFQLVFAGMLAASLLVAWWLTWEHARRQLVASAAAGWLVRLLDAAPWLILGACALQAVEAWFVFRALARKEREAV
ncbi:MAG: hypothetical protein ACRC33_23555 [Gemmataceae bacterium]